MIVSESPEELLVRTLDIGASSSVEVRVRIAFGMGMEPRREMTKMRRVPVEVLFALLDIDSGIIMAFAIRLR